jgi:hypothetical protein
MYLPTAMSYVGADALASRKRRRHDNDDQGAVIELYSPAEEKSFFHHHHHHKWARKVLPLPSKRARFTHHHLQHDSTCLHENIDRHNSAHRRRHSREYAPPSLAVKPRSAGNSLLAPCHICAHQPKQKAHLDSFALCQGCGEQTCYICIRQCQGWNAEGEGSVLSEQEALSRSFQMRDIDDEHNNNDGDSGASERDDDLENRPLSIPGRSWKARGHQSIICRRCCVEPPGSDGEVACFGCLPTISST